MKNEELSESPADQNTVSDDKQPDTLTVSPLSGISPDSGLSLCPSLPPALPLASPSAGFASA